MKALKFIINGEEQDIPQGWWDGIGRTLYVNYRSQRWELDGADDTVNEIKNNVVLVFDWPSLSSMPTRIYDSDDNYIDISGNWPWNALDSNWVLLGIIKVESNTFQFYPRYWGTLSAIES
jgi:hypothetical protein